MISFIRGKLFSLEEENAIVDVNGVGYHILIPPSVFPGEIKTGDEIFLYTYLQIREDCWQLFGFPLKEQLNVFRILISVSGVGARLGLAVLNHFSYREIVQLVCRGDSQSLSTIPGIGKKIAQRLVLELKEKFKGFEDNEISEGRDSEKPMISLDEDVVLALTQLGYPLNEARLAFVKISKILGPEANTQELIKGALKLLGKY